MGPTLAPTPRIDLFFLRPPNERVSASHVGIPEGHYVMRYQWGDPYTVATDPRDIADSTVGLSSLFPIRS
jgi:hypothetical protein